MSAKFSAMPAALAAGALIVATPLEAAAIAPSPHSAVAVVADLEGGTSYHRRYWYRRGPDVGDVLTGVLIVGGIAAAADAIGKAVRKEPRYRDDPRYRGEPRYRDGHPRGDERYRDGDRYDGRGIDRAVSMCVDAAERDSRVDTVERVDRTAQGWRVEGRLSGGRTFVCTLGSDGRIDAVEVDGRRIEADDRDREDGQSWRGRDRSLPEYGADRRDEDDDRQYDDDHYARAWSDRDANRADDTAPDETRAPDAASDEPRPEYPGGPLPGEDPAEAPPAPTV